ncbi:hypothetical protein DFH27DRAFT_166563 [Peziza echinospora]|nr:hypothetical protein DFH27DRAFT_166563 [Peziza echinospora]
MASENEGRWLGPMPVGEFLSEFLPLPKGAPAKKEICFKNVATASNEADSAAAFIKSANEADLPRLSFVNTTSSRSPHFSKLGPDVTGVSDRTHVQYIRKKPNNGKEQNEEVDLGYSELIVEMKRDSSDDAFNDPPPKDAKKVDEPEAASGVEGPTKEGQAEGQEPVKGFFTKKKEPLPFERGTMAARAIRGQLATYEAAQSGAQFRAHSFSLFIFGTFARFIRWDRRCAIVSARFEYGTSPNNYIADFLHRYSQLDDEGRGKDTTLTLEPCSGGDCPPDMAEQLHNARISKAAPATRRNTELRKVLIPDQEDPDTLHPHIISYPLRFVTSSPFGRATRTFLAYNPATQRIVFVKDYWRPAVGGITKEGDIYKKLKENGVRHIAPFGHGNDIAGQKTIDLSKYEWAKAARSTLQHYRMSLRVIGGRLQDFPSTRVLVGAVADAMEGHDDAFWNADILHRDISIGNILIAQHQGQYCSKNAPADEEVDTIQVGSGFLIDWDVSVVTPTTGPLRAERTGTWHFMSAALLDRSHSLHSIEDDRESSFYVILYGALRYSNHKGGDELPEQLGMFSEFTMLPDGFHTGGRLKELFFRRTSPYKIKFNPPLDAIIAGAARFFRPRYAGVGIHMDDELLNNLLHARHFARLERMQAKGTWVAFLREKLNEPDWPENDFHIHELKHELKVTSPSLSTGRVCVDVFIPFCRSKYMVQLPFRRGVCKLL